MTSVENTASFSIRVRSFFIKYEPWIFAILILLNAIPLLTSKYFVTVDGPSHLNNAAIINNLLFGNDSAIHDSYSFNPEPVPNWTAYILLSILKLIGPSWFAEKILLLLYTIGLPYTFRFMLRSAGMKTPYVALLILPFTYNFLLMMGFFNFAIAFLPLFIFLGIYFKTGASLTRKIAMSLFIWAVLLYFSHIYVFAAGLLILAFHALTIILKNKQNRFSFAFNHVGKIFLLLTPVLSLFIVFICKHPSIGGTGEVTLQDRFTMLSHMQCLSMFSTEHTEFMTKMIAITLLFLLLAVLFYRIRNFILKKITLFRIGDSWLLASGILFYLFLTLSDNAGGGMNTWRLLHLFVVVTIVWLALNVPPKFITIPILILILFAQTKLIFFYTPTNIVLSKEADEWADAGRYPEKNSITLPIFFNKTALNYHNGGYFGAENSRMIADNYEAAFKWFPIIFNHSMIVRVAGQKEDNPFVNFASCGKDSVQIVKTADYVVVWQQPSTLTDSVIFRPIDSLLQLNYSLSLTSQNIRLFKLKK